MSAEVGEIRYDHGEDRWVVKARPDVAIMFKRVFPRARDRRSGWLAVQNTPEMCRDLEWMLDRYRLKLSRNDRKRLQIGADAHRQREDRIQQIMAGRLDPTGDYLEPAREPRDYQRVAAEMALAIRKGLILADDLGTGKTMSGLLTLQDPDRLPALVLCPTHLPGQWMDELEATFPSLRGHVIQGLTPYDPAKKRGMGGEDPDVLICPYSRIRGWGQHLAGRVRTLLLDEVQEARRPDSDKYDAIAMIAEQCDVVEGMSATPVYNYGIEAWNIYNIVSPGTLGSKEEFGREWCGGNSGDKARISDPRAFGEYLRGAGLMLRRTRKDVGRELPECVRIEHAIDTDEAKYESLEMEAVTFARRILESSDQQEVFQSRKDLDWRLRQATGIAKAPFVAEFVKLLLESEPKIMLFGWHRAVYDIWAGALDEFDPVFYTGSESANQKAQSVARFLGGKPLRQLNQWRASRGMNAAGESRVFIMSVRSGAGLDGLQRVCRTGVFGELDWSPGMHDQCEGRYHRDGQAEPGASYFLVSNTGTDPAMAQVLGLKRPQGKLMVDPDAPLFESRDDGRDRLRELAEQVLERRGIRPMRKAA